MDTYCLFPKGIKKGESNETPDFPRKQKKKKEKMVVAWRGVEQAVAAAVSRSPEVRQLYRRVLRYTKKVACAVVAVILKKMQDNIN
jgi:hypothetical protein